MKLRIRRRGPLRGEIAVPGDKSIAHRALIFAGMARGGSILEHFPGGADNRATAGLMTALGAGIEVDAETGVVRVEGFGDRPREAEQVIDCHNSGTTARLGLGLLAGFEQVAVLTGDESLRRRPMARVVGPLRAMGAQILGRADGQRLPMAIRGGQLGQIRHESPVASAQVKSAILLAGLTGGAPVELVEPTLSRDHTERFLMHLGYPLRVDGSTVRLEAAERGHEGFRFEVPGDPSSAAFWAALAALDPAASVSLPRIAWNPGRIGFFRLLGRMGVDLEPERIVQDGPEDLANLHVRGTVNAGLSVDGPAVVAAIDELPMLALMGLFVESGVRIADAAELRAKETDRIETTAAVARAFGGEVETWEDGLFVRPGREQPSQVEVDSAGDHRIAMAAAVVAAAGSTELLLEGAEAVSVSYPGFWETLARLGVAEVDAL